MYEIKPYVRIFVIVFHEKKMYYTTLITYITLVYTRIYIYYYIVPTTNIAIHL